MALTNEVTLAEILDARLKLQILYASGDSITLYDIVECSIGETGTSLRVANGQVVFAPHSNVLHTISTPMTKDECAEGDRRLSAFRKVIEDQANG